MQSLTALLICIFLLTACENRDAVRSPLETFFMNAVQIVYDSVKPDHPDGN